MKKMYPLLLTFWLCTVAFAREGEAVSKHTVSIQDTSSGNDAGAEIFEYSTTDNEYQTTNPPIHDLLSSSIPRAPNRPLGQTIAGMILCIQGGASITIGILSLITGNSGGDSGELPTALPITGLGFGMLIPGSSLLSHAHSKWGTYNKWEKEYGGHTANPTLKVRYTLHF